MSSLRLKFALGHSSIKTCSHELGVPMKTKKNQKKKISKSRHLKNSVICQKLQLRQVFVKNDEEKFQVYILKIFLSNIFLITKASTMTLSFPKILISIIRQILKISSGPTTGRPFKVQSIFESCTLFFRKLPVVPYKHPFSDKFSKPCTLWRPLFRNAIFFFRKIALSRFLTIFSPIIFTEV